MSRQPPETALQFGRENKCKLAHAVVDQLIQRLNMPLIPDGTAIEIDADRLSGKPLPSGRGQERMSR